MLSLFDCMRCWPASRVVCQKAYGYTAQNNDMKLFLLRSVNAVTKCVLSLVCVSKKRKDTRYTRWRMHWKWDEFLVCIQLHSVKSLSRKTEDFVIISHSKLGLYHDGDLLYVCVINSSHSTSTSGLPRNRKHSCKFCHSQLVKIRRLRQNWHNSCFLFRSNPFRPIACFHFVW